jgi:hypothetical protein
MREPVNVDYGCGPVGAHAHGAHWVVRAVELERWLQGIDLCSSCGVFQVLRDAADDGMTVGQGALGVVIDAVADLSLGFKVRAFGGPQLIMDEALG